MESDNDKTQSFIALTIGTEVLHYKILEKTGEALCGEAKGFESQFVRRVA